MAEANRHPQWFTNGQPTSKQYQCEIEKPLDVDCIREVFSSLSQIDRLRLKVVPQRYVPNNVLASDAMEHAVPTSLGMAGFLFANKNFDGFFVYTGCVSALPITLEFV